jgi:hypothetical protein
MGSVIEGFILIGLALLGIREGERLRKIPLLAQDFVGPGWYVFLVSVLLLAGAVAYVWVNRKDLKLKRAKPVSLRVGPAGWALGSLLLYAAIVPLTGYALASTLFFILVFHIFGVKSWLKSIGYGVAAGVTFELFFSYIAGIPIQ